jgi:Protein of unknown function (DUF2934)
MALQLDPLWCGPGDEAAQRQLAIARVAYFRAQQRGFAPGHELEDWLAAEQEVYRQVAGDCSQISHETA